MNSFRSTLIRIVTHIVPIALIAILCLLPLNAFAHDGDEPVNRGPTPTELRIQKLFMGIAGVTIIGALVYRFGFRGKGQADRWE